MQVHLPQDRPMMNSSNAAAKEENPRPLFTRQFPFSGPASPFRGNLNKDDFLDAYVPSFVPSYKRSEPASWLSNSRCTEPSSTMNSSQFQFAPTPEKGMNNHYPSSFMSPRSKKHPASSPVPSLVSSEYEESPYSRRSLDWNSPPISRRSSTRSGYATPFAEINEFEAGNMSSFASPPPSSSHSSYYFTPVNEEGPRFPVFHSPEASNQASNQSNNDSFPASGFESNPHFSPNLHQASQKQMTTPVAPSKNTFMIPALSPEPTEVREKRASTDMLSTPRSLEHSYLSTVVKGKENPKNKWNVVGKCSASPYSCSSPKIHRARLSMESPSGGSHLPQNLKGDPHRQAKVKTELCAFFSKGKKCPFGSKCNYAHGDHELKYTTLMEMDKAGLVVDIDSYRAYPCFSWVCTGACPFGLRCSNIHDPRAAGSQTSWLPHCDIPVSSLPTDLIVDKSYHQNLASLSQKNPLIQNLLWDNRPSLKKNPESVDGEWRDTYSLVCNLANLNPRKGRANVLAKTKISELQRLSVANHMGYGTKPKKQFVYKPKHTVYNELCMVLRTKYFCLLKPEDMAGSMGICDSPPTECIVKEISKEDHDAAKMIYSADALYNRDEVIVVQELAFGLCGEPASRVSLWFDLANNDMAELSLQDVKKLKRGQQRIKGTKVRKIVMCYPGSDGSYSDYAQEKAGSSRVVASSSFDTHPHRPFFRVEPVMSDTVVVSLVQSILNHRIGVLLQREYRVYRGEEAVVKAFVAIQDADNKELFRNIKNSATEWQWPVTKSRQNVNEKTGVPKTLTDYTPSSPSEVTPIWNGFLNEMKKGEGKTRTKKRLPIFKNINSSESDVPMPHIKEVKNPGDNNLESFYENWEMVSNFYRTKN